jgi:uncharacterized membrane protein
LKGHLSENESKMLEAFELEDEINQTISKLTNYAKIEYIKNKRNDKLLEIKEKNKKLFIKISFIRPELLSLPNELLKHYKKECSMIIMLLLLLCLILLFLLLLFFFVVFVIVVFNIIVIITIIVFYYYSYCFFFIFVFIFAFIIVVIVFSLYWFF